MLGTHDLALFVISGLLLNFTPGADTLYIVGRSALLGLRAGMVAALGIGAGCCVHMLAAALGLSALLAASATAFTAVKLVGAAYLVYLGVSLWRSQGSRKSAKRAETVTAAGEPDARRHANRGDRRGLVTWLREPAARGLRAARDRAWRVASRRPTQSGGISTLAQGGRRRWPPTLKFGAQRRSSKEAATMRVVFTQGVLTNVLNPKVALFFLAFLPQFVDADAPNKLVAFVFLGLVFNVNGTLWNLFVAWFAAKARHRFAPHGRAAAWMSRAVGTAFVGLGVKLALSERT